MRKVCAILLAIIVLMTPIYARAAEEEVEGPTYYMIFLEDNRIEVDYGVYGPASGRNHRGIDIDTLGDPTIHATIGGTVQSATVYEWKDWTNTWEWGYYIIINGDDGYSHLYAHCAADSFLVSVGDRVEGGQAIATMGDTGNAAYDDQAEHVHYQINDSAGNHIDPTFACGIENKVGSTDNPIGKYVDSLDNPYIN